MNGKKPLNEELVTVLHSFLFYPDEECAIANLSKKSKEETHSEYYCEDSTLSLEIVKRRCKSTSKHAVESPTHEGRFYTFKYMFWRENRRSDDMVIEFETHYENKAIAYLSRVDEENYWSVYADSKKKYHGALDINVEPQKQDAKWTFEKVVRKFKMKMSSKNEYIRGGIMAERTRTEFIIWHDIGEEYESLLETESLLEFVKDLKKISKDHGWK